MSLVYGAILLYKPIKYSYAILECYEIPLCRLGIAERRRLDMRKPPAETRGWVGLPAVRCRRDRGRSESAPTDCAACRGMFMVASGVIDRSRANTDLSQRDKSVFECD